jgi:hypothetical protein
MENRPIQDLGFGTVRLLHSDDAALIVHPDENSAAGGICKSTYLSPQVGRAPLEFKRIAFAQPKEFLKIFLFHKALSNIKESRGQSVNYGGYEIVEILRIGG